MYSIFKITSHPTVDFAAEELKKYLRMMMPRCGEIDIAFAPEAESGFRLGLMADFGLCMPDARDPALDDIVYITADEKGGVIAGSNPGALLIAVYRYLRFCGCRWLFPGVDGEWIPVIEKLPAVNYRKLADHRYRGQCNEGAEYQQSMMETIDFTPKICMNTYMLEFDNPYTYYRSYYSHNCSTCREAEDVTLETTLQWKRQCEAEIKKRGLKFHDMGHGWTAEPFGISSELGWTKVDETDLNEENRQYLAQINGERKYFGGVPLNTNICLSNPKARSIIAEYVANYAQTQNNVDFLHIWLADASNNHCECENCRRKDTSDWYVMLLNDIDAALTRKGLDTHLVFIVYVDTFWPPIEEKLNNHKRFTMLYAPITRLYTETYGETPDFSKVVPYDRNKNDLPRGMAECLAYLHEWKKMWPGDCFCYEYHFWLHQHYDISSLELGRLLHNDITALRGQGLSGIVEDGSQRSFFPTGFPFYVYGETLFDASVTYDELKEDYFSHAFGENWKEAVAYLEKIAELLPFEKISVLRDYKCIPDASVGETAKEVPAVTAAFAPVIEANLRQPRRASTVSWQLLKHHITYTELLADYLVKLTAGDMAGAKAVADAFVDEFSRREIYIERYYDHNQTYRSLLYAVKRDLY
ncbi:MAG: DUF4838 domain-containing protein [Oscillospiraceae bacterium]|nr:DUF4838 domain-containing protein [Oscillospiraceae bacterium]